MRPGPKCKTHNILQTGIFPQYPHPQSAVKRKIPTPSVGNRVEQRKRSMVSTKEVYRRNISNLVSKIVGIVMVTMQPGRNPVRRLARNVSFHCGKPNHFENVCRSKRVGGRPSTRDRQRCPRRSLQTVIHNILSDRMRIYLL